jgi:iron(III) transport system substrate-binding protein
MSRRHFSQFVAASMLAVGSGLAWPAQAAPPAMVEAARKEGKLVVYGDSSMVPFLVEGFSKSYPDIRVTSVTGGSWQTYNRFLSEQSAGRTLADVLMGGDDSLLTADRAGYVTECGLQPGPDFPATAIATDLHYVVPQGMLTPIIYNSSATSGLTLPKDWSDFAQLGKEWDGLIIIADPRNSGTALAVLTALYDSFGPDKAGAIVAGLKRLNAEIAPNTGVQVAKIMSGERPLTATLHMGFFKQMRDKGAPVEYVLPTSGSMMQYGGMGVTKDAPHPNAGKLFVDFTMSQAGAAILAERGTYPSRIGSPVPDRFPDRSGLKLIAVETSKALTERDTVIAWWQRVMEVS